MPSAWKQHLDTYRASHTEKSLKECMVEASACYRGMSANKHQKPEKRMDRKNNHAMDPLLMLTMFASHEHDPHIHMMTADEKHYIRFLDTNSLVIRRDGVLPLSSAQKRLFYITDELYSPECRIDGPDAHTTAQGALVALQSLYPKGFELHVREGAL